MKIVRVAVGVFCLAMPQSLQASADELILPPSDGRIGICAPLGCDTRIQQVFDASLFPSMIRIEALVLFNYVPHSAEGFVEPARYQFFLSSTPVSSATITTDFDANVGAKNRRVIDWTVSDFNTFFTSRLELPLSRPFVYNPRRGNLLLEILKDQTGNHGDGPIYVDGNLNSPGVQLVSPGHGLQPGLGFSVGFVGRFLGPFSAGGAQAAAKSPVLLLFPPWLQTSAPARAPGRLVIRSAGSTYQAPERTSRR